MFEKSRGFPSHEFRLSFIAVTLRQLRLLVFAVVALSFLSALYLSTRRCYHIPSWQSRRNWDIANRTLGFEKVFAIGFPQRTDKHDAITLASSFTEIDVTWIPAVAFEDISRQAAPPTWDFEKQTPGALGCWRAHMNVLEKIVSENIQSAVILEDDADWDLALKQQLNQFALGAQALQNSLTRTSSPYGDEWDLLWLGHCGIGVSNEMQEFFVIENDHTVPPVHRRRAKWRHNRIPAEVLMNNTRLIYRANGGVCTAAYAVTYEAARKILGSLSISSLNKPVDLGYSDMCRERMVKPFRCYAPYPPLFGTHRFSGPKSRDSDINNNSNTRWHQEYTYDIVYSTIQNIHRLAGEDKTVLAQWPEDVTFPEREIDKTWYLWGSLHSVYMGSLAESKVSHINTD